jgi:hypothetical protein
MVFVPGGPVALDGTAAKDFSRDFGTTVACTPGFWMAVHPVTNGEYRTWLKGKGRPLPLGWTVQDLYTPVRRADLPACGMFPEDAGLFALSRQSRLPTEVEWRRAAYTRDTGWVEEMNRTWLLASRHLSALFDEAYREYTWLWQQAGVEHNARLRSERNRPGAHTIVKIIVPSSPKLEEVSSKIQIFAGNFLENQEIWGQVHQIDGFRQDTSVFGVRNVLCNAPELVHSRQQETLFAPKFWPAISDPDLMEFNVQFISTGIQNSPQPDPATFNMIREIMLNCLTINSWRIKFAQKQFSFAVPTPGSERDGSLLGFVAVAGISTLTNHVYAGFRCAR